MKDLFTIVTLSLPGSLSALSVQIHEYLSDAKSSFSYTKHKCMIKSLITEYIYWTTLRQSLNHTSTLQYSTVISTIMPITDQIYKT